MMATGQSVVIYSASLSRRQPPLKTIIEQDRQFLHDLLRARTNATFHGQHREIDLGASGKEVFTTPGALDAAHHGNSRTSRLV